MHRIGLVPAISLFALVATSAAADQVFLDDLIVNGSACVGPACQTDEDFGFDTLRLKGDVLRVRFQDTSSTASFPTTDWQVTVNDDDAGTGNRFSIEDLDAGTTPFTLEAGAPTHSLYVAGDGRVGIGTGSPDPAAALDVRGDVRVDQIVDVTGQIRSGAKAGIVPASAFVDGVAAVSFATPQPGDYTVLLTPVADSPRGRFKPAVLSQDANGFTLSAGKKKVRRLVEMHWLAQPVGE